MSNIFASNNVYIQTDGGSGFQYKIGLSGSFNALNFPCTIINSISPSNVTIFFTTNMTFTNASGGVNCYFICGGSNIIFDGNQNTITLDSITNYPGLIQNGDAVSTGYNNIIVKNINVDNPLNSSSIISDGGYICQSYFSRDKLDNVVQNCSSSGDIGIGGNTNGGIVGSYVGINNGSVSIIGCFSTGAILAQYSGGITGRYVGQNGGSVNITSCYSTGVVNSYYGGGICGIYTCNANITYCYSAGNIGPVAYGCGGIVGGYACSDLATDVVTISRCFSLGDITGSVGMTGSIGGIAGGFSGGSSTPGTFNIINCYSMGAISEGRSGICGLSGANINITNCYSLGNIGNGGFGIAYGMDGGFSSTSVMNITNSYSLGNIGANGAGICYGINGGPPSTGQTINITNCYTSGTIAGGSSGLVLVPVPPTGGTINILSSFASGIGSWSDITANTYLTGTPVSGTPIVLGPVWNSVSSNTPYLLSAFQQQIYNPSSVNTISGGVYTSAQGVFQSSYTYELVNNTNVDISINAGNGEITIDLSGQNAPLTFTPSVFVYLLQSSRYSNYNFNSFTLNYVSPPIPIYNICFAENTPVLVDQAVVPIQKINTKLHTIKNKKIVAITKTQTNDGYLVRFEKHSLGRNYPCGEVIVSKDHKILFNASGDRGRGDMIEADYFVNRFIGVKRIKYNGEFLYNIIMEDYESVSVNNMICETLHPANPIAMLYRIGMGMGTGTGTGTGMIGNSKIIAMIIRAAEKKKRYLQRKKNAYTNMGTPRFTPFIM